MKDSFVIYTKYEEQISLLTDTQAGGLLRALMKYQSGQELPKMDEVTKMAFSFIKQQIDYDNQKYQEICEVNKVNGRRGGRPAKSLKNKGEKPKKPSGFESEESKPNGFLENRTKPKKPESDNDKDNDNIKEKGTYVPKKKSDQEEDERTKKQKEFFNTYPHIAIDNYSSSDYEEIDFEVLLKEFALSKKVLQKMRSFSWICANYRKIANGCFRDWADNEKSENEQGLSDEERRENAEWFESMFGKDAGG